MGPCSSKSDKKDKAKEGNDQPTNGTAPGQGAGKDQFQVGPDIFVTLKTGSISN